MNFYVLSLFPEMIDAAVNASILKRAADRRIISVTNINIRDFSNDKHRHVDDYPYGGGAGMVMMPDPVVRSHNYALDLIKDNNGDTDNTCTKKVKTVYMTPQGRLFDSFLAKELSKEEDLIILCGHYEGIDERALKQIVTDEISIGDYVLSGGEIPAMVIIDAVSRFIPGVLHNTQSADSDSFSDGLLEYPQYTRPYEYNNMQVPKVLLSGNHREIERWRREKSIKKTIEIRPDLLERAEYTRDDLKFLISEISDDSLLKKVLVKYKDSKELKKALNKYKNDPDIRLFSRKIREGFW